MDLISVSVGCQALQSRQSVLCSLFATVICLFCVYYLPLLFVCFVFIICRCCLSILCLLFASAVSQFCIYCLPLLLLVKSFLFLLFASVISLFCV